MQRSQNAAKRGSESRLPAALFRIAVALVFVPALAASENDIDALLEQAMQTGPVAMQGASARALERLDELSDQLSDSQRTEVELIRARHRALEGDYQGSIALFEELIERDIEPAHKVHALEMAANLHARAGHHHRAFQHLLQALERTEEINNPVRRARVLSLAAFWFMEMGAREEARALAGTAASLLQDIDDEWEACIILEKLGLAWDTAGELELARSTLERTLAACRSAGDPVYEAAVTARLGHIHHQLEQLDRALDHLDSAVAQFSGTRFDEGLLLARIRLGHVLFDLGRFDHAADLLESAVAQISDGQRWQERADAHRLLARIAMQQHDHARAYEHMADYRDMHRRHLESERERMTAFHEVRFDVAKRERELALLRRQARADTLEAQTRRQRSGLQASGYALIAVLVIVLALLLIHATRQRWHYRRLSRHDRLTGLYNHTHFFENADAALEHARRQGETLTLILADIDHFKDVNDTFGHLAGDDVLRQAAARLRECFADAGPIGRIGGEEFAMIVPGEGIASIRTRIDRLRKRLQRTRSDDAPDPVTMSLGIAILDDEYSITELRKRADRALYRAKHLGRDRVVVA